MKPISILTFDLLFALLGCQPGLKYEKSSNGIKVNLQDGTLSIYPVADNAVRIKFIKDTLKSLPELIFTSENHVPDF